MQNACERWQDFQKQLKPLKVAMELIDWDLRTTAPKNCRAERLETLGAFSAEIFRRTTSKEYRQILEDLAAPEVYDTLSPAMQLTVRRSRKKAAEDARVPADFHRAFTEMHAACEHAWEEAKAQNDYALFAPWLKKNIEMTKEYIGYIHPGQDPFAALFSRWVEGITCKETEVLFDELLTGLLPLLDKIKNAPAPDLSAMPRAVPVADLKKAEQLLLDYMGLDTDGVTVFPGAHGLTGSVSRGDIRIVNNYREDRPLNTLLTAIHEGGHAIYDQNPDPALEGTAAANLIFSDLHESQSRFYENVLGRNINFWKPIWPALTEAAPALRDVPLSLWERALNDVRLTEVRTEADELTYCLHILLRFQMERELFSGALPAENAKDRWNELTREYLGFVPSDDAHGILQDLHWSSVFFGYFPTYLLGSLYDGMFLEALTRDLGSADTLLSEGRIKEITAWLKENIHKNGSLENPKEILARVCKKPLSAGPLLRYFTEKYARLYGFEA